MDSEYREAEKVGGQPWHIPSLVVVHQALLEKGPRALNIVLGQRHISQPAQRISLKGFIANRAQNRHALQIGGFRPFRIPFFERHISQEE
ncbi:MAG: hypothetical protein EHM21_09790 [Chloroflexi bacterium]|nr:MAG: hypothetical protein EHM21_09790 [Chloroflexota bacterium]